MPKITFPDFTESIVKENGKMVEEFSDWTAQVSLLGIASLINILVDVIYLF